MSSSTEDKLARLKARNAHFKKLIDASISSRWGLRNWDLIYPWWCRPPEVRILMYADGPMQFSGGTFGGLQYVKNLLESRAYPHVDFDVTTAHRQGVDPTATITSPVSLTDLNLDSFDEIWFFGYNDNHIKPLTKVELALVDEFMTRSKESGTNKRGGVLISGDHSNLGEALGRNITRAGMMRSWDVDGVGEERHSSLEEGPDVNLTFDDEDQSDDRPQTVHYRRFPVDAPAGVRLEPHPVLCGPDGPIDVLPDHQHEGEAVAPSIKPNDPAWPTNSAGHQESPFVIAWGDVKDPQVQYRQFGVISAYNGHTVDAGRIVADSSWHHWVDLNLIQPPYDGFDATPQGQAALKKIDAYFLNCGTWLAPPEKQLEIRNAAWWSVVWSDRVVEIPAEAPVPFFGEQAIKTLRRFASNCAVSEWILGPIAFNNALSNGKLAERSSLLSLSLQQHIGGGILKALMSDVGPLNRKLTFPDKAPSHDQLTYLINAGTAQALSGIKSQLESDASDLLTVIANNFQPG